MFDTSVTVVLWVMFLTVVFSMMIIFVLQYFSYDCHRTRGHLILNFCCSDVGGCSCSYLCAHCFYS